MKTKIEAKAIVVLTTILAACSISFAQNEPVKDVAKDVVKQSTEQATIEKMRKIEIPEIAFRATSITDVVSILRQASHKYDNQKLPPERRGVNIILKAPAKDVPPVTFFARYMNLYNALTYITELSGLKFRVKGDQVLVMQLTKADKEAEKARVAKEKEELEKELALAAEREKAAGQVTIKKMKNIQIPEIDFRKANIQDVVGFLERASKKYDSEKIPLEKRGITILLYTSPAPASSAALFSSDDDPFAPLAEPPDVPASVPPVTFSARNMNLYDALTYITELSGLKFRVKGDRVLVMLLTEADEKAEKDQAAKQREAIALALERGNAAGRATIEKMKNIQIPEINLQKARFEDVVAFFQRASKKYDSEKIPMEKRGINIVLTLPPAEASSKAADADPFAPVKVSTIPVFPVTFSARNMNLYDALTYVFELSGCKFSVRGNTVIVTRETETDSKGKAEDINSDGFLKSAPVNKK